MRRILKERYRLSASKINDFVELVRKNTTVLKTPSGEEFSKIIVEDKSDRPIVYSARRENCILIMRNKFVLRDAKKYVRTKTPEEFFEEYVKR